MIIEVGTKLQCNGYPGTVTEICSGQLTGMAVVRLDSGDVCVSISELKQFNKPTTKLCCAGEKDCNGSVTYIDEKGFVYCGIHGPIRSFYRRCRKLKPKELTQLESGTPLKNYQNK
jgi:hypothetical protein